RPPTVGAGSEVGSEGTCLPGPRAAVVRLFAWAVLGESVFATEVQAEGRRHGNFTGSSGPLNRVTLRTSPPARRLEARDPGRWSRGRGGRGGAPEHPPLGGDGVGRPGPWSLGRGRPRRAPAVQGPWAARTKRPQREARSGGPGPCPPAPGPLGPPLRSPRLTG